MSYPLDRIRAEVAFVAYHFHWSRDCITAMPHGERHAWVRQINDIHEEMRQGEPG